MEASVSVTELLRAWSGGDETVLDRLIPLVERELRQLAARHMRRERPNHTLQTTGLMNEAYIRLTQQHDVTWQNRSHFFAIASRVMRRVLIDHAKARQSKKRGGGQVQISLAESSLATTTDFESLLALDEALGRLEELDPIKVRWWKCATSGLTVEETASVLKVAPITVMRHWSFAKAWLQNETGPS